MSESAHHAPAPQSTPIYKTIDPSKIKRQGDTWLLNSQLTYTDSQNFLSVHFISNGQSFTTISYFSKDNFKCLYYDLTKVNNGSPLWLDDNYRVISLTHKPDKKLLAWLAANGVKI